MKYALVDTLAKRSLSSDEYCLRAINPYLIALRDVSVLRHYDNILGHFISYI